MTSRWDTEAASSVSSNSKSLENLIKQYLEKTEELEYKEEKILMQVEQIQSAVNAFQEENERNGSKSGEFNVSLTISPLSAGN